jgi:hypothetical protein
MEGPGWKGELFLPRSSLLPCPPAAFLAPLHNIAYCLLSTLYPRDQGLGMTCGRDGCLLGGTGNQVFCYFG